MRQSGMIRKNNNRWIHTWNGWHWILPSLIGVMTFSIIPFGLVFYFSSIRNIFTKQFVGLQNYVDVLSNDAFRLAVKNTLIFTITAIPLSMIIALLFAAVLDWSIPGKNWIRTYFFTPMMVPTASVVLIWQALFHDRGYVNSVFQLGGDQVLHWLHSDYGMVVIVLIFVWKTIGYNMILFTAGLSSVPENLVEAARLDGASERYIFLHIKLRYLSPVIFFVVLYAVICSFKIFREVYMLVGNYPVDGLYMLQNFINNTFQSGAYPKLSSAAIWQAVGMVIIIGVLFGLERKFGKEVEN